MEQEFGAAMSGTGALSVRVAVTHTGGWGWESRWLLLTKYVARLKELYGGAPMDSNTDLWAVVNSFMIDCYQLKAVFTHGAGLGTQATATVNSSPEILVCRDYANTWKHFYRDSNSRVAYIWETGDSETGGQYVKIGHRLRDDPIASQTLVDGFALARASWDAWRAFMSANGLPEPTGLTQPYIDKISEP